MIMLVEMEKMTDEEAMLHISELQNFHASKFLLQFNPFRLSDTVLHLWKSVPVPTLGLSLTFMKITFCCSVRDGSVFVEISYV
jgi:hypothetical protein